MEITVTPKEIQGKIEIFCCYSREDQHLLRELKKQLMPLRREGLITLWADTDIDAGAEWEKEIHRHLNEAHIILLLVSPDFIASDYCYSIEMKRAMERHESREAQVIPIILRPVQWQDAPFGKLQMLPTNARPVTSKEWGSEDEAFLDIAKRIQKVVVTLLAKEKQRRQAERERARQEQEQAEQRETEMARSSKLPPLRVKRVKRSSSRRIVLVGLAGLVIVALIRGVVWFTAHQTPLTRGIQASLAGRITSGANATTAVQATSGIPGKTWHTQIVGPPQPLLSIAWSGSQFVVVGDKGAILTSPDGHTWTPQNSGTTNELNGVVWSDSQFIVVGAAGTILTSPDGHTWTPQNSGTTNALNGVAWSGSRFVVVGATGTILTSP